MMEGLTQAEKELLEFFVVDFTQTIGQRFDQETQALLTKMDGVIRDLRELKQTYTALFL